MYAHGCHRESLICSTLSTRPGVSRCPGGVGGSYWAEVRRQSATKPDMFWCGRPAHTFPQTWWPLAIKCSHTSHSQAQWVLSSNRAEPEQPRGIRIYLLSSHLPELPSPGCRYGCSKKGRCQPASCRAAAASYICCKAKVPTTPYEQATSHPIRRVPRQCSLPHYSRRACFNFQPKLPAQPAGTPPPASAHPNDQKPVQGNT